MSRDSSVIADPASGTAIVAGTRVAMSAAADGALRFSGAEGRVLRPLSFAERTELVSAASALPAARDAVAAAILATATLEPGAGATPLMEVLAMWLAGAAFDAPDFLETTLLVARAAGWSPHELFTAPAREVDRLAVHLDEQRRASEWKSLVFAEAPDETIEAVRARFADRLLRRSGATAVETDEEPAKEHARNASPGAAARERSETPLLPRRVAAASEPERTTPMPRQATPIASLQTSPSRGLEETPLERAAPAQILTTERNETATTAPPPPPAVRGVRLVVPREERDRPAPSTNARSVAATGQRPALAFSIRQPRAGGTPGSVTALAHATTPLPRSGSAAPAVAVGLAESLAVVPEERELLRLEPRRETSLPERARRNAPYAEDLAATLASLLDDEADLRGVER
jgi:hypothetical protein